MATKSHLEGTLEEIICDHLTENGWNLGVSSDYQREVGLDPIELFNFILSTQKESFERLVKLHGSDEKARKKIIERIVNEIQNRDPIDVIRNDVTDTGVKLKLAYFAPEFDLVEESRMNYQANRLTVTRQVRMSESNINDSIDLVFFLNGIPLATAELKSQTAGQNVRDAIKQYRYDRKPNDLIFRSRSLVNFAIDEDDVYMTTQLRGANTEFRPFNLGENGAGKSGGKGNPLNPSGERTQYFWHQVLQRDNWLRILGSYIHINYPVDEATGKRSKEGIVIFPRFHQWHAVESLISVTAKSGHGLNRLAQHSAGSGKSNTISWLAHRLSVLHTPSLKNSDEIWSKGLDVNQSIFDKVIVVTNRRALDTQLRDTVASFDHQPGSIFQVREDMGSKNEQLRDALSSSAVRIITTTIQTFPFVTQTALTLKGSRFAIIIDEAHSGHSGDTSKDLKLVLGGEDSLQEAEKFDSENSVDDETIETLLEKSLNARGKADNVTFFAFTATPSSKTLEMFGEKNLNDAEQDFFVPFHTYSMKQAIEEGYILDVLKNYTSYKTYYRLANNLNASDLEVPKGKAASALARFASLHPTNLAQKAEIIVEHFRANTARKIGGKAKAMVVTRSRLHAVRYKQAIDRYLLEKQYSDLRTLVAFSGTVFDPDAPSIEYTEFSMNEFKSSEIPREFAKSYQVLIVAEKFQTGFDQPLLHTMYVDKKLAGINAVQTLSRLNRTHPEKEDTFILDFANEPDEVRESFRPYFEESYGSPTDPNILYDLQSQILGARIIFQEEMSKAVQGLLSSNAKIGSSILKANTDPAIDRWHSLDEEERTLFKSNAKKYVSAYSFLGLIVPFKDLALEELYYYLKFLVRRLLDSTGTGTLDIDDEVVLTHLRTELIIQNADLSLDVGSTEPLPPSITLNPNSSAEPDSELLSKLIAALNERFGLNLTEADRIWFEQQQSHHAQNPELREVALANDYDNFAYFFEPKIESELIERHEANEDLFKAFFNQPDFRRMMTEALSKSLYNIFNSKG